MISSERREALSTGAFTPEQYRELAQHAVCAEWNPRRFHAIILRAIGAEKEEEKKNEIPRGKGRRKNGRHSSAIVYSSGNCVLTGAGQTVNDVGKLRWHVCSIVNMALQDKEAQPMYVKIVNIVAHVQLPFRISAERAVKGHIRAETTDDVGLKYQFDYEPLEFLALKCKIRDATTTKQLSILAFNNGKLILTGLTDRDQLENYYDAFVTMIKQEKIAYDSVY